MSGEYGCGLFIIFIPILIVLRIVVMLFEFIGNAFHSMGAHFAGDFIIGVGYLVFIAISLLALWFFFTM